MSFFLLVLADPPSSAWSQAVLSTVGDVQAAHKSVTSNSAGEKLTYEGQMSESSKQYFNVLATDDHAVARL